MKVLQINTVCGIGSTGRIATDINNILAEQGHESYIAYGRDLPQNCDASIKVGTKFDNYSHLALTRLTDKHGFGSKKATEDFIKEVEKINPDVIHLHNIHGYYINIEILFDYLNKANKIVIWTLHDCWAFTGHCSNFDYINCYKWKTECCKCPEKNNYPRSLFIDNSKNNFYKKKKIFTGLVNMTLVTPSKWLEGLVKESFLSEYPVRTIQNGLDLNIFKPIRSNFREKYGLNGKFIILGVANIWGKRKGYDYFIELSKLIDCDEVIVMIGLSEKEIRRLPPNIIGVCRTRNTKELAGIYSTADVFINPTIEDNFPTTNLESLACGTPVITFNTGGSAEGMADNCGFVVNKGDMNELLNKIIEVKQNGKQMYTQYCLETATKLYNKKNKFEEYLNLYKANSSNSEYLVQNKV